MAKKKKKRVQNVAAVANPAPAVVKSEPVQELTEGQVIEILNFAKNYYSHYISDPSSGFAYSPETTNQRLSEISLSPDDLSEKEIESALKSPLSQSSQDALVGYSEFLQFSEAVSKRTLLYLGNLPAFDYTVSCTNAYDDSDYQSEAYKADLRKVKQFLSHFDVRGQMSYVTRRALESEAFYAVFRTDGNNYQFQELPAEYCIITGRNLDWGFLFDFDMSWFLKQGLSLKMYPKNFTKMWKSVFGDIENLAEYNPANKLANRKGTYALWSQTSPLPEDGAFVCFKFNADTTARLPFLTSLFSQVVNKPLIKSLQTNQYMISAQKILVGLIPYLKDQKSGQVANALAIDAKTLAPFLALLKQGLSDAVKVSGAPFSDLKDISFPTTEKSIYDEYNTNLAKQSGATGALIYGSQRPTATEITLSAQIDTMIATSIYPSLARWLSTYVNTLTTKYKFRFAFEGNKYTNDRKERLDTALKLADKGVVLPQKIAAAIGMDIFDLEAQLREGKTQNFYDLLYLLPNANTASFGGDAGRPAVSDEEAADSTLSKLDRDEIE